MNVDGGGALSFKSIIDNDQMNAAIDETLRRIKGLSDGTVAGGKAIDDMFDATSENIRIQKDVIVQLESQYKKLQAEIDKISPGKDQSQLIAESNSIRKEIDAEKEALKQLDAAVKSNENTQVSMRTRIRALREEMMLLVDQGIDEQSEAYKRLETELGRLTDIQLDVQQQARTLANDEAQFQGIITGLSGLAGGFSAVTGAVSLFSGENEDLQKVMTKLQSVMAITMGVQQVAQALNKDSAFQLVTLNSLKKWWRNIVIQATAAESAETIAKKANTVATGQSTASEALDTGAKVANTAAAKAGTVANLSLAGAFRAVGLAIKSIPVIGWIITGISALIGLYAYFSSKAEEAAKAQEELNQKIIELAAKPVGSIIQLQNQYASLGNSMKEKEKFIRDNAKVFEELGLVIRDVADAERLLSNPANVKKFIQAQIDKARSLALLESDSYKEALNKYMEIYSRKKELEDISKSNNPKSISYITYLNTETKELESDLAHYNKILEKAHTESFDATKAFNEKIEDLNKESREKLKGTIAGQRLELEDEVKKLEADKNKLSVNDKKGLDQINKQIENVRKKIKSLDGNVSGGGSKTIKKDVFSEMLNERKKQYSEYAKWINSTDESIRKATPMEFSDTLKGGNTYLEYLNKLKENTTLTKEQLHTVLNEIANETNGSIMDTFKQSLDDQMSNAQTVIEQLNAIQNMRNELKDEDQLKVQKKQVLDEAEKSAQENLKSEIEELKKQYADYAQQRLDIEKKFNADLAMMYDENGNLINGFIQAYVDELKRQYTEALAGLDNEFSRTKTSIEKLFGDMSKKSVEDMRKIAAQAQDMMDFITGGKWDAKKAELYGIKTEAQFKQLNAEWAKSPEKLEAIDKAIQDLYDSADQSETAFNKMSNGLKKIFNSKSQKDLQDGLDTLSSGLQSVTAMSDMFVASLRNIGEIAGSNIFTDLADGLSQVMDVANSTMQGAQSGAAFGPVGAAVGAALGLVSSVTKIFSENKKYREELKKQIEENNLKAYLGEFEINRLYRERYEWAKKIGETEFYYINRNGEELKKQSAENAKDQDELWKKLIGSEYKKGEHFEKTGLFGWGKGKIVTDWGSLSGKTWEDIELLAEQGKLSEEGMKYYEALKLAKEEGEDLAKRQEEYVEYVKETFTGTTYENVVNSIVDGFKAGKRSAADFASTFEELMQGAMVSALQMAADDKVRKFYDEFAALSNDEDGLTESDIDYLNKLWDSIINSLSDESERLEQVTGMKLGDSADTSLTGAVKGVSEETASMLGGQMNAIRINQMESTEMLRQQLFHLANIDLNTGSIDSNTKYIKAIYDKMSSGDSLRSQGLS